VSNIDNITIQVEGPINNITLGLGESIYSGAPNVTSVDGMTGNILLTFRKELTDPDIINGEYTYNIEHNFNTTTPTITVYDLFGREVFAAVRVIDENNVRIIGSIDLTGYEAVLRR
jgi:hypothetical protein